MKGYILSIDQGTTGTTAVLVNSENLSVIGKVNKEFLQIFPKPGEVEHDLNDIWKTVEKTVLQVLQENGVSGNQIDCIGITNQRETTCAFDRDGTPLANAIVWQDRRTTEFCEQMKSQGQEKESWKITGLPIDPYFSATKMRWLLNNNDKVKQAAKNKTLHFGTIDTFLLYKLTCGVSFSTEVSNASRTLLMNLKDGSWDNQQLKRFEVSLDFLPEIKESFGDFGMTKGLSFLPDGIPITGILGDQQAALFGQTAFKKGEMKCTYGTGAFILLNTGDKVQYSNSGLLSTAYYRYAGKTFYALEGSCYIAGASVQWLRDNLQIIESSPQSEELAGKATLQDVEHLMFLPYFSGIASPHWKPEAKGAIVGITRDSNRSHLVRACLEGIALSINDLVLALKKDCDFKITNLRVDGGACANNLLMEMQANFCEIDITRPKVIETTAYGAAMGAAIGADLYNMDSLKDLWGCDKTFNPEPKDIVIKRYYKHKQSKWQETVNRLYLK